MHLAVRARALVSGLRARLVIVTLIAIAPVLALTALSQFAVRRQIHERTVNDNLRLLRLAAAREASWFDGSNRLLETLGRFPSLRNGAVAECNAELLAVLKDHPGFVNLAVIAADGRVRCSSNALTVGLRIEDRDWFQRALPARNTIASTYQHGRTTGTPDIVVARPVPDEGGETYVLAAALDVRRLQPLFDPIQLPAGATLTLLDRAGTILARSPDGSSWVGKRVAAGTNLAALHGGAPEAVNGELGVDGVRRLYLSLPVDAGFDTGLRMSIGLDPRTEFVEANRTLRRQLWVVAAIVFMILGAVFVVGQRFVIGPVLALRRVTAQLASGDFRARAALAGGVRELSELGEDIDSLAWSLESRKVERDAAESALRASEDQYRLLFEQNPHPMWVYDRETLAFLEVNDAAMTRYGYSRGEFLAMRISDIRPAEDVPRLTASIEQDPLTWNRSVGWRHRLKDGSIIDVEVTAHGIVFHGRSAELVTAQDVTDRLRAETALAERTALTALLADIGVAFNRPHPLDSCLHACSEAIVAYVGASCARIWTLREGESQLDLQACAGDAGFVGVEPITLAERVVREQRPAFSTEGGYAACPLMAEHRIVGAMTVLTGHPLSEPMNTGLANVAEHIALGITRRRAEAARRLLASIITSSEDAIFATTLDGTIVSWNGGAERLYGFPADEAIGKPITITYPDDRADEFSETLRCFVAGDSVIRHETVRRRKDGTDVCLSLTVSPIRDVSGNITGKSVVARDITERQRAERSLRESQERFRLIAGTVTQVFWIADADINAITYVSPAYARIWGRSCESLYAQPRSFLEAVHSEDREHVLRTLALQQTGQPFDHEYRIIRADGETRWIWDRGFPVPPTAGGSMQYVGVAEDVTDRKAAAQSLHDAEERMRFALEASNVGIWEANLKTGVAHWSETCERMHGLATGTFGRTMDAFAACISPDDRERVVNTIRQAIAQRRDAELEYQALHADGTIRLISSIGRFTYDENGIPARGAGVAIDITDRRSLEQQLRQSQKMEAIGQLAGGIAHDFNNLLTAILGFANFVRESLEADDARRQDVDEIRYAADRAAALTKQLLAFSRKQILSNRVLHFGDVVAELTPMLRRLVSEAIDLRTTTGDRRLIKADPSQLQQVVMNLVVNARDAMPNGGRLTIETGDVEIDEEFARRHAGAQPGPHAMLTVRDTGHGIDAATLPRIFEPFFTTKAKGEGSGLGLATVYGIVTQSGGGIWVESEVGRGTSFTVCLPMTEDVECTAQEAAAAGAPVRRGNETVLLVEDEDVVREFVLRVLRRHGYAVHALPNPLRAIEYAEAHKTPIDLVFTDVVLPEMNGKAMVSRLRTQHPEAKVLYMSGYDDDAIVQQGVLEMDTELLQKPFTADALARRIRDVLDAR